MRSAATKRAAPFSALKLETPRSRIHERRPYERVDILGIDLQRLGKEGLGARNSGRILAFVKAGLAAKIEVHRVRVRRALRPTRLCGYEGGVQLSGETGDDFVLHREKIGDRLVETLGPEMRTGLGVDKLGVDPHSFAASQDAPFEHVADAEFSADLFEIDRLALVGEGGVPGDNEGAANPGEIGRQAFRHPIDEGSWSGLPPRFAKGSTKSTGAEGLLSGVNGAASARRPLAAAA